MLRGLILTEEDEKIEYEMIDKQIDFILLRAGYTSYGMDKKMYQDNKFSEYYDKLVTNEKEVFVYYESCATNILEARKEAKYFINIIKNKQVENPIFLFMNDNHNTIIYSKKNQKELQKSELIKIVNEFTSVLNETGYEVLILSELLDEEILKKIKIINDVNNCKIILLNNDTKDNKIEIVLEHSCFIDKVKKYIKCFNKKIKLIIGKLFKLSK